MICDLIGIKQLITDITDCPLQIKAYCDNQAAIAIATNPIDHSRTKHIDIKFHFVRQAIKVHNIILSYVKSAENPADLMTKLLARPSFELQRSRIHVIHKT